jgi:catechol 2,3-dioxygenase-like lactoylglutathione lyase family enzyme
VEIPPEITRDIYGMPAFVTLRVRDLDRTVDWYVNGLDFISLFTMPGPGGSTALVHLRRWRYQDILVQPGGGPNGNTASWTLSVMAEAAELADLGARARAHGGGSVEGPVDTPWNTRDLRTVDPDGNIVIYTARRPPGERDEEFSTMMQELSREQLPPQPAGS